MLKKKVLIVLFSVISASFVFAYAANKSVVQEDENAVITAINEIAEHDSHSHSLEDSNIYLAETRQCPVCKGSGNCSQCKGSGRCSHCGGSGYRDRQHKHKCTSCSPSGSGKCSHCNRGHCPNCAGRGTVTQ